MNDYNQTLFNHAGFTSIDFIENAEWKSLFDECEREQRAFNEAVSALRSADYIWPIDALHNWSRAYEYPFMLHHLRKFAEQKQQPLRMADFGSGVLFFPFMLAPIASEIVCIDANPICIQDLQRIFAQRQLSNMSAILSDGVPLPLSDASLDVIYSISVLEHTGNHAAIISEMHRTLAEGGHLLLSVDIDLRGDAELSPAGFSALQTSLNEHFLPVLPEVATHPAALLTNMNSICKDRLRFKQNRERLVKAIKQKRIHSLRDLASYATLPYELALHCSIWQKR